MHGAPVEVIAMMSLWPLAIVLAVGLALTLVLLAGSRLFPGTRSRLTAFRCPFRERDVSVEFEETVWTGEPVDVRRCTVFSPPTAVTCAKGCLHLERLPAPRTPHAALASRLQ